MRTLTLLMIFFFFVFTGCKKSKKDNTQPENSGNLISFKINGRLWQSSDLQGGIWQNGVNDYRYIHLFSYNGSEGIWLYINRPFVTGTKPLNENTLDHVDTADPKNYGAFNRYVSGSVNDTWMTNAVDTGHCTITYIDSIRNFMKGDFSFQARNQRTGEVITISNGHFELVVR
jgi:hypothetical protein